MGIRLTSKLGGLAFACTFAASATVTFDLDFNYGSDDPAGPGNPWLRATVSPYGTDNTQVKLTLESLNTGSGEFISYWAFNLDETRFNDPSDLTISSPINEVGTVALNSWSLSPGGSRPFFNPAQPLDLEFSFKTSPGNSPGRFNSGEVVSFILTATAGTLLPEDFTPELSGNNAYHTAARVQGIAGGGSAKLGGAYLPYVREAGGLPEPSLEFVPVPEPSTYAAGVVSLAVIGWTWQRRRQRPV